MVRTHEASTRWPDPHILSCTVFTVLRGFALLQNNPLRLLVTSIQVALALLVAISDVVRDENEYPRKCRHENST